MAAAGALANQREAVLYADDTPPYIRGMFPFYVKVAASLWLAWLVSWQLAALWRDKPTAQAPRGDYRVHFLMVATGMVLMYGVVPRFQPLLWHVGPILGWSMIALTAAGIAFAWWARIALGKLWSGGIERMAEHRVVDTGPYALVRHPIYTGLIAGAVAMAGLQGKPWPILGAALFSLGFVLKARVEERFLEKEIGGYEDYRRRVSMIVPLPKFS
uniref:methyltransferase family protein n=1 Tax=Altererythrobacter segetis TaxID=1104773 RepID=UPI001A9C5A26|nr:isoprenylcysteine carboxylmethyltransferase family protein [Altererythrobacter segetis]